MKYLHIFQEGTIGYMREGKEETNFLISLETVSVRLPDGERIYEFKILVDGDKEYFKEFSAKELNRNRWVSDIPAPVFIQDRRQFYKEFQRALIEESKERKIQRYIMEGVGLQEVEGRTVFVFSNGAITSQGFETEIYTRIPGFYFSGDIADKTASIKNINQLMDIMSVNIEVFYPLFLANILSVLALPFKQWGLPAPPTIWLDGNSGSGKTSLAKAVATFTDQDVYGGKKIVSSTERIRQVTENLVKSAGIPFIFDDVKYEATQRQREKSRASFDIVLRSVYQGEVTELTSKGDSGNKGVCTCAVVTGEYMETSESQNARLVYLNISEFIQDPDNRIALKTLQEHPTLMPNTIGCFIQWWIRKNENSEFRGICLKWYDEIRKEVWIYEGLPNGERLKTNRAIMQLATGLFQYFIKETGDIKQYSQQFIQSAEESVNAVVKSTFHLLGGMEAAVRQALGEVLEEASEKGEIRQSVLREVPNRMRARELRADCGNAWVQEEFCILRNADDGTMDAFVFIPENEKTLEKADKGYIIADEAPVMIIEKNKLLDLIHIKMEEYVEKKIISAKDVNKVTIPLLARMQLIYGSPRKGGGVRGDKKYPLLSYYYCSEYVNEEDYWGGNQDKLREWYSCDVESVSVVQCNLSDPLYQSILKKYKKRFSQDKSCYDLNLNSDVRKELLRSRKNFFSKAYIVQDKHKHQ